MQAIQTRYSGPTNTRGSRITARAYAGKISISYNHALSAEENHHAAAKALVIKLGWTPDQGRAFAGRWIAGSIPGDHSGNVYVLASTATDYNDGFDMHVNERGEFSAAA